MIDSKTVTTMQQVLEIELAHLAMASAKMGRWGDREWKARQAKWEAGGQHALFAGGASFRTTRKLFSAAKGRWVFGAKS